MKSIIILLSWLTIINSQQKNENLNSMIAAEFAFAASSLEIGVHDSFLKFIADDGILFRPTPLNGKKFLIENNKTSTAWLNWYPAFAVVSNDGTMGLSTGPWEYKRSKYDSIAAGYGNFSTVWEKQSDGEWKFVIDYGNDNPKPLEKISSLTFSTVKMKSKTNSLKDKNTYAEVLIDIDKQINNLSNNKTIKEIYESFTNEDSRLLRDGYFPVIGKNKIIEFMRGQNTILNFIPSGGKIASSKDFGFTYGILGTKDRKSDSTEKYGYMHVWKKAGTRWILLLDTINKIGN